MSKAERARKDNGRHVHIKDLANTTGEELSALQLEQDGRADSIRLSELRDRCAKAERNVRVLQAQIVGTQGTLQVLASAREVLELEPETSVAQVLAMAVLSRDERVRKVDAAISDSQSKLLATQDEHARALVELDVARRELSEWAKKEIEQRLRPLATLLSQAQAVNDEIDDIWWACAQSRVPLGRPLQPGNGVFAPSYPALRRRAVVDIVRDSFGGLSQRRRKLANDPSAVEMWLSDVRAKGFAVEEKSVSGGFISRLLGRE